MFRICSVASVTKPAHTHVVLCLLPHHWCDFQNALQCFHVITFYVHLFIRGSFTEGKALFYGKALTSLTQFHTIQSLTNDCETRKRFYCTSKHWPFPLLQSLEPGAYPDFSSLSPPEQTTPVQPRNHELEQRAKAMRGRMWVPQWIITTASTTAFVLLVLVAQVLTAFVLLRFVLNELIQTEKDYVKDLGIVVEVRHSLLRKYTHHS